MKKKKLVESEKMLDFGMNLLDFVCNTLPILNNICPNYFDNLCLSAVYCIGEKMVQGLLQQLYHAGIGRLTRLLYRYSLI